MTASILAVITTILIFLLMGKTKLRYGISVLSLLILMPLFAYITHGLHLVFAEMSVVQVLVDFAAIMGSLYASPIEQMMGKQVPLTLLLPGYLALIGTFIVGGQIVNKLQVSR